MNDAWSQLIQSYPFMATIWQAIYVTVSFSALFAYSGTLFISSTAKIIYISRSRVAYDKCARQLARLAMFLGWILLVGGRVWLYLNHPAAGTIESFLLEMSWLLLSLGVLLSTVYYTMWGILKKMPVLHVTLGIISAAQNCVALLAILLVVRISRASTVPLTDNLQLPEHFPNVWNDPVWSAACFTLPLIFAMAAAFGSYWIALGRKYNDYGRDFYKAMLPWCAKWARNSWGLLWLLFICASAIQAWLQWQNGAMDTHTILIDGIRAILWLLPLVLWQMIIRSEVPMRHRWALGVALLFAVTFMLPYFRYISTV